MNVLNEMLEAVTIGTMPYDDFLFFEDSLLGEYELAVSWQDSSDTLAHLLLNLFLAIKAANTKQAGAQPIGKYIDSCEMAQYWKAKALERYKNQTVA